MRSLRTSKRNAATFSEADAMCCSNSWLTIGAVMGALGVGMGAFGAHGVDSYFAEKYAGRTHDVLGEPVPTAEKYLADYKTAAAYQMYHALALVAVGLLSQIKPKRSLQIAGCCFLGGILLFSGGLYVYTLADQRFVGMVPVPIGGTLFIVGWIALAKAACPCRMNSTTETRSHTEENAK